VILPEETTMELFTAFDRAVASTAEVVKATPAGQREEDLSIIHRRSRPDTLHD
jgi:hypothetical protein